MSAVNSPAAAVSADAVTVTLGGTRVLDAVTLEVRAGEVLAIIGPNGAGKSTMLGVLAGDVRPASGGVHYSGTDIRGIGHLARSRRRAVLLQENSLAFPFRVREVIEMGRSPWSGLPESDDDLAAIDAAVAEADVAHLLERHYPELSGGEKARVSFARVLAQRTPVLFLDEPTAALDLRHQEDVMTIARRNATAGRAVVVVLHDLSLAGAYADRIALLDRGRLVSIGSPAEVLTADRVESVYRLPVEIIERRGRPLVVPTRSPAKRGAS